MSLLTSRCRNSGSGGDNLWRTKRIGQAGLALIKQYEGCRLAAYKCSAGVWTIGYGHTAGVHSGMTITQAQADAYLQQDIAKFEGYVNNPAYVPITANLIRTSSMRWYPLLFNLGPETSGSFARAERRRRSRWQCQVTTKRLERCWQG